MLPIKAASWPAVFFLFFRRRVFYFPPGMALDVDPRFLPLSASLEGSFLNAMRVTLIRFASPESGWPFFACPLLKNWLRTWLPLFLPRLSSSHKIRSLSLKFSPLSQLNVVLTNTIRVVDVTASFPFFFLCIRGNLCLPLPTAYIHRYPCVLHHVAWERFFSAFADSFFYSTGLPPSHCEIMRKSPLVLRLKLFCSAVPPTQRLFFRDQGIFTSSSMNVVGVELSSLRFPPQLAPHKVLRTPCVAAHLPSFSPWPTKGLFPLSYR